MRIIFASKYYVFIDILTENLNTTFKEVFGPNKTFEFECMLCVHKGYFVVEKRYLMKALKISDIQISFGF